MPTSTPRRSRTASLHLVTNKEIVAAFQLNDPSAFAPPKAWFEAPLPNRAAYVKAGQEVKASVGAS